jgi:large subunit ribosomal protein L15
MKLHELSPQEGSSKVTKRKGRGLGTGNGKTAGKGHKGQKARSSAKRPGFEGGQMPLARRLPKRGFTNDMFRKSFAIVSLADLDAFEAGSTVTAAALKEAGIIKQPKDGIKVLANGELTKKLDVKLQAYSESAKAKIEEAGGSAEVVAL